MRLGQIRKDGAVVAAIFEGDAVFPIPVHSVADLIRRAEAEHLELATLARQLASRHPERGTPLIPLHPVEVWAAGCTYEPSAAFRDSEQNSIAGMYAHVFREPRPELFMKGSARVCVGPGQGIGLRPDSRFTAPEPELALILGSRGKIVGYTLANDVSAWDIERENPLYLPQSKVFNCCCALGPYIVTPDEIVDPYAMELTCVIERGSERRFEGSISTARMHRRFETLTEYLLRGNAVPAASVLLTGTGIIVPESAALQPGDRVDISAREIGTLSNPAMALS